MAKDTSKRHYDIVKEHGGRTYTGMAVGGHHDWDYKDGRWSETKVSPDKWTFTFDCDKHRTRHAPAGSGAAVGTRYHWYIVADQRVAKLDEDTYHTSMSGIKFKVGYRRPHWRAWSYEYPGRGVCYEDIAIAFLKGVIEELEARKRARGLGAFLPGIGTIAASR
ncbi:MAG: hypothetical protein JW839_08410 [Candidatus Lokiarchaeota archaeon]|nr:hypothetical protein [Candidatus Lokiarchaeota archaeon]